MKDHKLLNSLWKEVEAGNVTASTQGDFTIFKYTQDCHTQGKWNDVNRQARGIIFQTDGTVVARPFKKFFNLGELPETQPQRLPWAEGVEIYEKVDGSCGIGYFCKDFVWSDYRWCLATPGSLESEQAVRGSAMLYENQGFKPRYNLSALPTDCTPVFEIIYPENRIVVDYGTFEGLVLLAIFEHNGEEWHPRRVDRIAEVAGFRRPKRYDLNLRDVDIPFEENSEGYVARFGNGLRVKVKSPTYTRIHRLLNYLSPKGVIDLIRGKEYGVTVKQLPLAIQRDFDDIRAAVQQMYNERVTYAHERLRALHEEIGIEPTSYVSRKDQALWIQANVENVCTGLVFGLLDGKDIEDNVWKLVLEGLKSEPQTAKSLDNR